MKPIRLMLVDAHGIVRTGLRKLLEVEPDMLVAAQATSSERALEQAGDPAPDVIVLGVSLPGMDGPAAVGTLRASFPDVPILALTFQEHKRNLLQLLSAGVAGCLPMYASPAELVAAIRTVHRGYAYLYPAHATVLVNDYLQRTKTNGVKRPNHADLTPRQRQVLALIAEGLSNARIAERLRISVKTVARHREDIKARLNLRSRADLIKYAIRAGLTQV